jgi:hypothetical protein
VCRIRQGPVYAGLDDVQVGDLQAIEVTSGLGEGGHRIGVGHSVRRPERGDPDSYPVGAPDADHRFGHLAQEPAAVTGAAAVLIVALVGAIPQELVEQIPVSCVYLYPVEAGRQGVPGRRPELAGDPGQFRDVELPGAGGVGIPYWFALARVSGAMATRFGSLSGPGVSGVRSDPAFAACGGRAGLRVTGPARWRSWLTWRTPCRLDRGGCC